MAKAGQSLHNSPVSGYSNRLIFNTCTNTRSLLAKTFPSLEELALLHFVYLQDDAPILAPDKFMYSCRYTNKFIIPNQSLPSNATHSRNPLTKTI
jgi:hypothetical protein